MSQFESGVSGYIHARATADVFFPVDLRGNASVCCAQCYLFREGSRRCGLTGDISPYPERYVSGTCPLIPVDDDKKEIPKND